MKRLILLMVVLLLCGLVTGFADDADQVTWDVDGSATSKFGINLDNMAMGFINTCDFFLLVTLVAEQDAEFDGEGIYGYVKVEDLKWATSTTSNDPDTSAATSVGGVTVKLMADPLFIDIEQVATIAADKSDPIDGTDISASYTTNGSISIGYNGDPIDVTLNVGSEGDWSTDTTTTTKPPTAHDGLVFGVDVALALSPIDVALTGVYGMNFASNPIGVGVKPSLTLDLGDVMDLKPYAAFDLSMDTATSFEASAGVTLELDADDDTTATVDFSYSETAGGDLEIALTEGGADDGLVEDIGASVTLTVKDLIPPTDGSLGYDIDVTGHYDDGDIKPYFSAGYDNNSIVEFGIGIILKMFDRTEITIDYDADDLTSASSTVVNDLGNLTIETKISL